MGCAQSKAAPSDQSEVMDIDILMNPAVPVAGLPKPKSRDSARI